MRFAPLVERVAGSGADAWAVHMEAVRRREAGKDIIFLTVGDPDQDPPEAVIDATVSALRSGRTGYSPTVRKMMSSPDSRRRTASIWTAQAPPPLPATRSTSGAKRIVLSMLNSRPPRRLAGADR